MRVLNVNSSIDLESGGGTAERSFQMSRALARQGTHCSVLTLDLGLDAKRIEAIAPARVITLTCMWKRFYVPWINRKAMWAIRCAVAQADLIHLMGHWSVLNALVYLVCRKANKPYVVCPAGALTVFGRSGRIKRLYNLLVGHAIIRNACAWIAVTESEFPQFEEYGIPASRVEVISNGVCDEDFPSVDPMPFLERHQLPQVPIILFMGRLNLIKGPDLLLQAFIRVQSQLPDYHLIFAGPDGGMLSHLQEAALQSGLADRVHFVGYVGGVDKSRIYHFAHLLVVPSRQEAMSIVALEAGICGTPVLLTDKCGFSNIRLVDARLEVPASTEGIAEGLLKLLSDPVTLRKIAPMWRNFVDSSYAWNAIVPAYLKLYGGILERRASL